MRGTIGPRDEIGPGNEWSTHGVDQLGPGPMVSGELEPVYIAGMVFWVLKMMPLLRGQDA